MAQEKTIGKMKLRVLLCGVGYWGQKYLPLLKNHPDVESVTIHDDSEESLKKLLELYPDVKPTLKLENDDVDCVIVATPVSTHYNLVKQALLAGKHVLCEKAFTSTVDEATELIALAEEKKVKLEVGHTYLFNPCVQYIQFLLEEKALGDVYYVSMTRVGMSPIRNDVNALWDLGAHDFSMLINWFGMPQSVSSYGKSYLQDGLEDFVITNLEFKNGIIANVRNSWLNPVKRRNFTIVGSEMMISFDDIEKTVDVYLKDGTLESTEKYPNSEPLKEQLDDFIQSILQDREPLVTGTNGLNVVKVLDAAQTSLKNRSQKINLS